MLIYKLKLLFNKQCYFFIFNISRILTTILKTRVSKASQHVSNNNSAQNAEILLSDNRMIYKVHISLIIVKNKKSYTNKASKINTGNNPLLFFGLSGISVVFPVIRVFPVSLGTLYTVITVSMSISNNFLPNFVCVLTNKR